MPTGDASEHEPVVVLLNPATGLGGYAFADGFNMVAGQRHLLTEEHYERYRQEKHNGLAVIAKVS